MAMVLRHCGEISINVGLDMSVLAADDSLPIIPGEGLRWKAPRDWSMPKCKGRCLGYRW